MRLQARGGHVWACRGVGIRQGVCRRGSGDTAQFGRADLQGEGGGFAGDPRARRRTLGEDMDASVGAGCQAARREDPQDDAALTLRRRHDPLVAFFKCLRNAPKKANLHGILVDEKLLGPN